MVEKEVRSPTTQWGKNISEVVYEFLFEISYLCAQRPNWNQKTIITFVKVAKIKISVPHYILFTFIFSVSDSS